jgi:hypothetical protein
VAQTLKAISLLVQAVLLALGLAVAALTIRCAWVDDVIVRGDVWQAGSRVELERWAFTFTSGELWGEWWRGSAGGDWTTDVVRDIQMQEKFTPRWTWRARPRHSAGWGEQYSTDRFGPVAFRFESINVARQWTETVRMLVIPGWLASSILLAWPLTTMAMATRRASRRRRLARSGHCPACGYDLRASPGRCPECGAVPAR